MLFIVGLTYCWSNGPIAPAIASEIFPQHVRDKALGLALLGQTACLLAITQPWPTFNARVGAKSYWLMFGLNLAALVRSPPAYISPHLSLYMQASRRRKGREGRETSGCDRG